jgi:GAF domain-containing protein
MTPFTKRNLLISVSVILFAGLLYGLNGLVPSLGSRIQHLDLIAISLMIMMSLVIMLFWSLLGVFGGLASFLIAMIFLYRSLIDLNTYYYSVLIMAFFLSSFIGYHIFRKINVSNQKYTVTMERIREDINLIENHRRNRKAEISAMGKKIENLLKLKNIADKLSFSLSDEDIIRIVSEKTFNIYGGYNRVLLFMVDEAHNELSLSFTSKGEKRNAYIMKKGGIFDRWAVKNMKSLLVKDVRKDFRFSVGGEEMKDDSTSLIIKPLIMESSILGILRVDSPREAAFTQYELRILDIIGELAAVALQNARLYRQTEELAIKDGLTGLYVHRYFMERLEEEVKRALHSDSSFTLLMLDIDDFKDFNDKHGHIAGDAVLKNIGQILKSKASAGDIVDR